MVYEKFVPWINLNEKDDKWYDANESHKFRQIVLVLNENRKTRIFINLISMNSFEKKNYL